jgi:hypothetical protein
MTDHDSPLKKIKESYRELLNLVEDDEPMIDAMVAVFVASRHTKMENLPWIYGIAPPSGAKSTILLGMKLLHKKSVYLLSRMTENGMVSAFRDPSDPKNDPSMLPKLHCKLLVVKDLTAMLSMKPAVISQIFGDLRDAFDGFYSKHSGTVGLQEYTAHFGMIAGCTEYIDFISEQTHSLGERFLAIRLQRYPEPPKEKVKRVKDSMDVDGTKTERMALLQERVAFHLGRLIEEDEKAPLKPMPTVADEYRDILAKVATLLCYFRTQPLGGHYLRAEEPYRAVDQLLNLARSRAIADMRDYVSGDDITFAKRIAVDSLPEVRRKIAVGFCTRAPGTDRPSAWTTKRLCKIASRTHQEIESTINQLLKSQVIDRLAEKTQDKEVVYRMRQDYMDFANQTGLFSLGPHMPHYDIKEYDSREARKKS